jgi:hypothetical protein
VKVETLVKEKVNRDTKIERVENLLIEKFKKKDFLIKKPK